MKIPACTDHVNIVNAINYVLIGGGGYMYNL